MKIHFVCSANAFRSRLAEAYINSLEVPGISATSSGTSAIAASPCLTLDAEEIMEREGIRDFASSSSKELTLQDLESADVIIFFEEMHYKFSDDLGYGGTNFEVWNIFDYPHIPAGEIFKDIKANSNIFLTELKTNQLRKWLQIAI